MKKIKTDDDDDVAHRVIDQSIIASIKITTEQRKNVYKQIWKVLGEQKKSELTTEELWIIIQESGDQTIQSREIMMKALIELSESNTILYAETDDKIYLL